MTVGNDPALSPASPAEQVIITAARAARQQCICGGACSEEAIPLPAALAGRLRRYLAEHPGHGFFHDQEGNVAMVLDWRPDHPGVRAAPDLETLLDELDATPAADLS